MSSPAREARYRAQRIADARVGKRAIRHGTEAAYNYDGCRCGECRFAHSCAGALKRAKRRLLSGVPFWALSAWERDQVADELAYREGRLFYRAIDDQVERFILPRWVPDGLCGPRQTVLEQLEDARRHEP